MRDPDKRGLGTEAWRSRMASVDEDPRVAANIEGWVVKGPYHPAWSYWMVGCIDLAEHPGVDPPKKQYPEAEFEVMIVSLDPKCYPPDPDSPAGLTFLTPPDLVFQFDGVTREQAGEICSLVVDHALNGRSLDSDFRAWWESALRETVAHYKAGRH